MATNKFRRTSVLLAGLTLATGAVVGAATPASAASAPARPPMAQGAYHHHNWGGWDDDDWDFRGLYPSRWACEREGREQTRGDWGDDDYICVRSDRWRPRWSNNHWGRWHDQWNRGGFRHGAWALYVED